MKITCSPGGNRTPISFVIRLTCVFQKFIGRDSVFRAFVDNLGLKLSGYTNTASAFLLKSLSELNGEGRLAYIMPLEFLNTGYGTIVKKRLIESGHLVAIINLKCEKDIFPDAITSVGIILYDACRSYSHVDFHIAGSISSLENVLESEPTTRVALERLNPESKWLSYFQKNTFDSQQVFDELSTKEVTKAVRYAERTGKTPDWIDAFFERLKTPADS